MLVRGWPARTGEALGAGVGGLGGQETPGLRKQRQAEGEGGFGGEFVFGEQVRTEIEK